MTTPHLPPPPPPPGWYPYQGWQPRPKPKGGLSVALIPLTILGGLGLIFVVFIIAMVAVFGSAFSGPHSTPAASPAYTPAYSPPSAAAPTTAVNPDDVFIATLQRLGLSIKNRNSAIAAGRAVCVAIDAGNSVPDLLSNLMTENGFTPQDAGHFLGTSIAAYCPQHTGLQDVP